MVSSLEELEQELLSPVGAIPIKKVSYTHDAMIDLLIGNPAISQGELAREFGYTQAWVSNIIGSDAFQARLAARKEELVDPSIRATVDERFRGLVLRSMEVVQEKLAKPSHLIPDNLVLRSLELSTKALGYGASRESLPAQPTAVDHLAHLANRLIDLRSNVMNGGQNGEEAIQGEFHKVEIVPGSKPPSGESS